MLCQCPKLTPLQSRLLASFSALVLLGLIYWSLSNPPVAYAAELAIDGSGQWRDGEDHNWHRIPEGPFLDEDIHPISHPTKRASRARVSQNDYANRRQAAPGSLTVWEYPNQLLTSKHAEMGPGLPKEQRSTTGAEQHMDLRRRDDEGNSIAQRQEARSIYISANTCEQPLWSGTGTQDVAPPQLTLYVSTQPGNKQLGPGGHDQTVHVFDRGFVNATINAASDNWYMAIAAPQLSSNFTGSWTYQLAVSIDDYFHSSDSDQLLVLVDTDYDSALLITNNLTQAGKTSPVYQQWMNLSAPYVMFAISGDLTGYMGMENSFCGLQTFGSNNSQIQAKNDDLAGKNTNVQMGMITRGIDNEPKQQFYITNLNSSSQYRGFLALDGNSTHVGNGVVGGGGKVWGVATNFSTKSDGNCQLMFNLTFCDQVAYAVPTNSQNETWQNFTNLQNWYDNYTTTWYNRFNWTLGQIACDTTSDARYSLAKNCTDCAAAYKEWLCAVSIPRCEDFSNPADFLQIRNVGQDFANGTSLSDDFLHQNYVSMTDAPTIKGSNAFEQTHLSSFATNRSRNQWIDDDIRPGPYKEMLPCEDLCYSLMQSCPASMNFACPYRGRGLETSYGRRAPNGALTCNYLGAAYYQSGASRAGLIHVWRNLVFSGVVVVLVMALM